MKSLEKSYRITNFDEFLNDYHESDHFRELLRSDECNQDAHTDGNFGLTHQQFIDSWREYASDLNQWDGLPDALYDEFIKEIDSTEAWHVKNGSINDEI